MLRLMRILFCTPQDLSNLAADDITDEQYLNRETSGNEVFIIDTKKGFMQERDDDYRGSCEISMILLLQLAGFLARQVSSTSKKLC